MGSMDYASQCSEISQKREKNKKKKQIPKPSQKYKFCIARYVDFSILYIFLNSFFKVIYHGLCITVFRNVRKKGKKQEKKDRPKPPKKFGILVYVDFFKNIYFSLFLFFKVTYHGLCITVFRYVQQKGKKQEKKERPKPPQKFGILVYVDFLKIYIFLFFLFFKKLIMDYASQCSEMYPQKGKKTRKKRKTK